MPGNSHKSLADDIARVLSANLLVAIVGFLGTFLFPRILSVESYAYYQTFMLYVGYIAVTHLGFPSGMMIGYAGQNYETIDRRQYKSELILLFSILAFFTAVFLLFAAVTGNRMAFYIGLVIFPVGINNSYKSLLQSWGRFRAFGRLSSFLAVSVPAAALLYYFVTGELPGDTYILIYIILNWAAALVILLEMHQKTRGVKSAEVMSRKNLETEKTGAAVLVGNYINVLFTSADKQFVKWFFSTAEFACYSFGMSMQGLMTVFITSIAQPLFPAMARGRFHEEEFDRLKEVLMIFGSLSGCAYFAASFIVRHFIPNYISSLDVIGIYFVVFPVMAVINCLFVNLYKILNRMREYVITLALVLGIAVGLNALFVAVFPAYYGVAIATVITYYIWFFIGFRQFRFIHFRRRDFLYLLVYTIGFFLITSIGNDLLGFAASFVFVIVLLLVFYRNDLDYIRKILPWRK